jgi:ubiquitin-conjugating enzyme E2 R
MEGFRVELEGDDLFIWVVWFLGPKGTPYEGGHFKAQFKYPQDYPMSPPEMRIISTFWHPNVYPDGKVCMSILHPPVADEFNEAESLNIRWSPVHTVETLLISFLSLLSDPDPSDAGAPANVDALREYRKSRPAYLKRCKQSVEDSVRALPAGYVAPLESKPPKKTVAPPAMEKDTGTYIFEDDNAPDGEEEQPPVGGPTPSLADQSPLADEVRQLRSIGIAGTDEHLLAVLRSVKGDVGRAIEKLTS